MSATDLRALAKTLTEIMMAGHLTPLAQAAKTAIEASSDLDVAARALLEAAGPADYWRDVDVGAGLRLIIRPGWGPLGTPSEYVHLSHEVS